MKTTLKGDTIQVRLLKPEESMVRKVHGLVALLSAMTPISDELQDHAKNAAAGLRGVLDLAGEPGETQ